MDERTLRVLEFDRIISMLKQYTVSNNGADFALSLRPSIDFTEITQRLNETNEAEQAIIMIGDSPIHAFPDVTNEVKRASLGAVLSIYDLVEISKLIVACRRAKQELENKKNLEHLNEIQSKVSYIKLHDSLYKEITRCIESEDRIADFASPTLTNIRRQIVRSGEKIKDRLMSFISSTQNQKFLQEPIVTMRSDRYVVPVKQEYRSNVSGLVHDQSSSGATVFIEPMSVVEANNELRDWKIKEGHEVERILSELSSLVALNEESLYQSINNLSILDFYFAKGRLSLSMKAVRPTLSPYPMFNIVSGRHPLLDVQKVVPINVRLGTDFRILIITGPNTGGKTVTLKTAGLFQIMTQSGLNIPAYLDTTIGIFENIYADIGDEQSIEQNLSTFSSHMSNIVPMIENANEKTLLLFDELGAGTDPVEGAALAMSILENMNERKVAVMASTHYSELKAFAVIKEGMENASTEFDVETLRPTYRLFIGIPGKSNAFEISKRLGLPQYIIDGAKRFVSRENVHFDEIISSIEKNKLLSMKEREETKKELENVKQIKKSFELKENELKEKRESILHKAKDEARELLLEAKERSEQVIKEVKQLASEIDSKHRSKIIEESRKKLRESLFKTEEFAKITEKGQNFSNPKNLKLGDEVFLTNIEQHGFVSAVPDGNGDLIVQVGILKVNANISNIKKVNEKKLKTTLPSKKIVLSNKVVAAEMSVRGQKFEEALANVDKYLDDAIMCGLHEVTIIHGKGQGILRNGVHDLLRTHPYVQEFRLGRYGEGEWGVTIVTLGKKNT